MRREPSPAPLTGVSAFTKDVVYLHGLMQVHAFFCWCLHRQQIGLAGLWFAGRMMIGDKIRLEPLFGDGPLAPAPYLSPWMGRTNVLSAYLAFSDFAIQVRIDALDVGYRFDDLEEMGIWIGISRTSPSADRRPKCNRLSRNQGREAAIQVTDSP